MFLLPLLTGKPHGDLGGGYRCLGVNAIHLRSLYTRVTVSDVSACSCSFIAWNLCTNMNAGDVTDTRDQALQASGCDQRHVVHMPHLFSKLPVIAPRVRTRTGDRSNHVSAKRVEWLDDKGMNHSPGAHCHPQMQRKIPSH